LYGVFIAPQVVNVNGLAPAPVVTLLDDGSNGAANLAQMARHRVVISDPEGAEINGTMSTANDAANMNVKILRVDGIPV